MANRLTQSTTVTLIDSTATKFYQRITSEVRNICRMLLQSPTCWGTLVWRSFSSPGLDQLLDMDIGSKKHVDVDESGNETFPTSTTFFFSFFPMHLLLLLSLSMLGHIPINQETTRVKHGKTNKHHQFLGSFRRNGYKPSGMGGVLHWVVLGSPDSSTCHHHICSTNHRHANHSNYI